MDRRSFLIGTAALSALPRPLLAAGAMTITAKPSSIQIAPPEYPATKVWAFDGLSPGPEIRVAQGERLDRQLINDLDVPTSIHWHGLRLDNAMDGVPGVTQPPVAPGESFDYGFTCPDAGTFWYHSHLKSVEQVERGLYGALIVEEPESPEVEADHVLILDDWRLDESAQIIGDFDNGHDLSHAGRMGNVVTTNGEMNLEIRASRGDRLRLRLINAANARIFTLGLTGLAGWIVATDGMPVTTPRRVDTPFRLAPAQRLDLIVDVTAEAGAEAALVDIVGQESFAQCTFVVGPGATPRSSAPAALPPNPKSQAAPSNAANMVPVRISGGAMAWLAEADSENGLLSGRELASNRLFWALNDYAGRPSDPVRTFERGEAVRFDFINETRWPHAMHIHGHHFHELHGDGLAGDFRDTTLVEPGSTRSVLMTADNPGDWLLHCHMLGHHAAGMGTWFRVS